MHNHHIQLYMSKKHSDDFLLHSHNFFRKTSPKVTVVKNGIILPAHENKAKLWADGGVIDESNIFLETTKIAHGYTYGGKYDFNTKKISSSKETVVYFNPLVQHWGHFICDLIGRLWYIKNNPQKYKIAYCGWNWHLDAGDFSGNFLELLELLGIKKEQLINVQQPTRFKKIIVPDSAFVQNEYYTEEFIDMINIIVKNALRNSPSVPDKIYFSRTKLGFDKEHGESKIEKIFKDNGYTILYPEKISVKDQICYFNKAKSIAMVAGSISHNLIFTRSSTVNAIILNKMNLPNSYQFTVDSMTKAHLTYIDAFFTAKPVLYGMGPFLLSVTKHLKRFLRDHNYKITGPRFTSPRDIAWFLKKYHEFYKPAANKIALKNQMTALSNETKQLQSQK